MGIPNVNKDIASDYPIDIVVPDIRVVHREARKPITQETEASCTPTAFPYCRSPHITVDQALA